MIERRGSCWRARYHGPDGRERNKSFRRKSDAELWLAQQRALIAQDDWVDPVRGRIMFGEYALSWLDSRTDLKPKTRHQYNSLLTLHVLPTWRTVSLAKITFEDLSLWVARLSLGNLGPSGVRQSVFVMSAALDHAVRSGRIRSNPAHGLGLPRPHRRDYVFLTHDQLRDLAAEAGPWRVFVLALGYTGLRWGEALLHLRYRPGAVGSTYGGPSPTLAAMSFSALEVASVRTFRFPGSWPANCRRPSPVRMLMIWCSPCPAAACAAVPGAPRACPLALALG